MKKKTRSNEKRLDLRKRTILKLDLSDIKKIAGEGDTTGGGSFGPLCVTMNPKDPKCMSGGSDAAATCQSQNDC